MLKHKAFLPTHQNIKHYQTLFDVLADFIKQLGEVFDKSAAKMLRTSNTHSDWLEGIAIPITFNNYNSEALRVMILVLYEKKIKVVTYSWH